MRKTKPKFHFLMKSINPNFQTGCFMAKRGRKTDSSDLMYFYQAFVQRLTTALLKCSFYQVKSIQYLKNIEAWTHLIKIKLQILKLCEY